MMKLVALVALFVVLSAAADPSPPPWPTEIEADIEVYFERDHSRFDGKYALSQKSLSELTISYHVNDQHRTWDLSLYSQGKRYIILEQGNNVTSCHPFDIPTTFPQPSFANYKYSGQYMLRGVETDVWKTTDAAYYDDAKSFYPIRLINSSNPEDIRQTDYFNVNVTVVNPSVFAVPTACNTTRTNAIHGMFEDCTACRQLNVKAYQNLGCKATAAQIQAFCGSLAPECTATITDTCQKKCPDVATCAKDVCCASKTCSCDTTTTAATHSGPAATHSGPATSNNNGNNNDDSTSTSTSTSGPSTSGGTSGGSGGSSGSGVHKEGGFGFVNYLNN